MEKKEQAIKWWNGLMPDTQIKMAIKATGYNGRRIDELKEEEIIDIYTKCIIDTSDDKTEEVDTDELVGKISDVLRQADPMFLLKIAEMTLTQTVRYEGDGDFTLKQE